MESVMLVRRPDRPQMPLEPRRPAVIPSPRYPGSFEGWSPKL